MKRIALVLMLTLAACGGSSAKAATAPTTTTTVDGFAARVPAGADHRTVNGTEVWVAEKDHVIYVADCTTAKALTAQGAEFGPSQRDADGNYTEGYGYVCT